MCLHALPTEFLGHKFAELHTKHNGVRSETPGVWETLGLPPTKTPLVPAATALLVPATAPKLFDIDGEGARVDAL